MLIYKQDNLTIDLAQIIDPEAINVLKRAVYGTHGVRYRQTGQEVKINQLIKPYFFYLRLGSQLIGMYCLDERYLYVPCVQDEIGLYYGRYLAVEDTFQGNGYGELLKQQAIAYISNLSHKPIGFYSYIEGKNTRSLAISKRNGFEMVSTLRTYFFQKLFPRLDERFERLPTDELGEIRSILNDYYTNFDLLNLAHIGYQSNYFVLRENGIIVAGVQANPVCWQFKQYANFDWLIRLNILHRIPLVSRLYNLNQFQFLAIEGVYLAPNRPDLLPVLLESVLAYSGYYQAMWQLDQTDPYITLIRSMNMGLLSHFQSDITTYVLVNGIEKSCFNRPIYISSFDFS